MSNFSQGQGNQRVGRRRTSGTPHNRPRRLTPGSRKRTVPGWRLAVPPVFGRNTFLRFAAFAVSLFVVSGFAFASSTLSDSAKKTSGRAHEEPFDESIQTDNTQINREVREIRVEFARGGGEKVFFLVNGFYPPRRLVLEGDRPRIACDFYGTRLGKGIGRCIKVNGSLIQQIRTAVHRGKNPKVRVVLDLVPGKNYEVDQIFYKKDNLYVIIVKEERADR